MYIVKSTGQTENFNKEKLRGGLRRAGVPEHLVDRVSNAVEERVKNGTTTGQIAKLVNEQLRRESRAHSYRYTLREGLLKLGPAGFQFEKYVGSILNAYGYETSYPEELHGACVDHEVDIMAKKDGKTVMIEAKFRNDFDYFVKLRDVMAAWTRFQDLNDGAKLGKCPKFDSVWIVTNGKISSRSMKFGACKGIRLLGWNYPKDESFAHFVDHTALYPVTVIPELGAKELANLSDRNLMLCRDLAVRTPKQIASAAKIKQGRAENLLRTCRMVLDPESDPHAARFSAKARP
ncbi:MAG TPA: ATP cone domain-containing protein [Patescibacteria group bacterium]|nr:ATP cone domain-containing protein [Patescibacteria group bacterium]